MNTAEPVLSCEEIADRILRLAVRPKIQKWIVRREEQIHVVSERTLRRRSTLDLDLSRISPVEEWPRSGDTLLLPIQRLSRRVHTVMEVRSPTMRTIHRAGFLQERTYVIDGLQARWQHRVSPDHMAELGKMLMAPGSDPSRLVTFQDERDNYRSLYRIAKHAQEAHGLSDVRAVVFIRDVLKWLENYLLIVEVPIRKLKDGRITITLEYIESIPRRQLFGSGFARRLVLFISRILGGTFSLGFTVPLRHVIGGAESVHVQLAPTPGFRSIDSRINVEYFSPADAISPPEEQGLVQEVLARTWSGGPPVQVFRDDAGVPESAHLYVRETPLAVSDASLIVSLYAYRSGFIVEAVAGSLLIFALTTTYFLRVMGHHWNIVTSFGHGVSSYAAALVPVVVAAVVTVVTNRDGARVQSKCFGLARFLLAVSGAAAMTLGILLALDDTAGQVVPVVWWIIECLTGLVALRLLVSLVIHSYRISEWRRWLYRQSWAVRDRQVQKELNFLEQFARARFARQHGDQVPVLTPGLPNHATYGEPEWLFRALGRSPVRLWKALPQVSDVEYPVLSDERIWRDYSNARRSYLRDDSSQTDRDRLPVCSSCNVVIG